MWPLSQGEEMQVAREDEGPTASTNDARKSSSVYNLPEGTGLREAG